MLMSSIVFSLVIFSVSVALLLTIVVIAFSPVMFMIGVESVATFISLELFEVNSLIVAVT